MELFSAIILLCTFNGNAVDTCSTISHREPFKDHLECIKALNKQEKAQGRVWAEANIYVVSSTCIDWKWQTNKQLFRAVDQK